MLFNSYHYLLFFPVVSLIYFLLPRVNYRILWLLVASYFFYMCWNPIFITLIVISTLTDYFIGIKIDGAKSQNQKQRFLYLSLFINLGIFFYFKYYNFIRENLQVLFDQFSSWQIPEHSWILPVGISFYTFQTLSYTIDVYRGEKSVERNFPLFALYVSFFPQLVAGPIERSTNLIPQLKEKHVFNYNRIKYGLLLILIGLFKKIVIADRFAIYVDQIFNNPADYTGLAVILGIVFFSFQIYCDFSGYTDIAIGSAAVLGYKLMDNFKGPYLSRSIREFWSRWHISLSSWFRDYVYIPLGGNRDGKYKLYRNLLLVFLITGIWHGANWTFILWGLFHGFFLIIERFKWGNIGHIIPSGIKVMYSFIVVTVAWILFRADNMNAAYSLFKSGLNYSGEQSVYIFKSAIQNIEVNISLFLLVIIMIIHFIEYKNDLAKSIFKQHIILRWTIYIVLILSIPMLGQYGEYKPFIYFQF